MKNEYEQIGVMALRSPDGKFLPSVPLYAAVDDQDRAAAEKTFQKVGAIFAEKYYKVKKAHEKMNNQFI